WAVASPGQHADPGGEMPNLLQGGPGRPLHPMLVHFPIALYPTSLVFDVLSHLAEDGNPYVRGAFALIVIALVVSVLTVAAGFADFLLIENGSRTWRIAVLHMSLQLVTAGLFLANAVLRGRDLDVTATPVGPIILSVVGLATLIVGASLGGELVYRHGRRGALEPAVARPLPAPAAAGRPRRPLQPLPPAGVRLRAGVPGREGPAQGPRPAHLDLPGPQGRPPADPPQVPTGEGQRVVDGHHQVVAEPGIDPADLGLPPLDHHPGGRPASRSTAGV